MLALVRIPKGQKREREGDSRLIRSVQPPLPIVELLLGRGESEKGSIFNKTVLERDH